MKFILNEHGLSMADVEIRPYIEKCLATTQDIHVSNSLALEILRAILIKIPLETRPQIEWHVYGKQVHFNEKLRSSDAWNDTRTCMFEGCISTILDQTNWK